MLNESNLHGYQRDGHSHQMSHPFSGLFLDMGLGKTVTTLTTVNKLIYEQLEVEKVLVIAPKRVAEEVWAQECAEWAHLNHLKTSLISGTAAQRKAALMVSADIYLLGRDNVVWLVNQYGGSSVPFDMLVIDESSSFKSYSSQRFKALKRVRTSFKRITILTATPSPNGLIDLWPQIYLLDAGERLERTITAYRTKYFSPGQTNGHVVYNYNLKKASDKAIHDKIGDICISMKAEDYLESEGCTVVDMKLEFDQTTKAKYEEFEKNKVLEFIDSMEDDEFIMAANAAALSNKLSQFTNGAVYDDDKDYKVVHDIKLDALEELIEAANGAPVLVAYEFRSDMERIKERLKKYKPVDIKDKSRNVVQDWNKGKISVLLMHPASGGHGLNLQKGGHHIIWFGVNWSLELYMQLNGRLDRQGQKHHVTIHRIVVKGTTDDDKIKALSSKRRTQDSLRDAIKLRIDRYKKLRD